MMEEFLKDIGLEEFVQIFEENDITLDLAKRLTENEVKELIPSLGKRKIFIEAMMGSKEESFLVDLPFVRDLEAEGKEFVLNVENFPSSPTSAGSSTASSTCSMAIVEEHREVAFYGNENVFTPIVMPAFDLSTLLESTPLGSLVINHYKRYGSLDNSKRTLLVDIVCKKIFDFIVKHRVTHCDYNILTAKIITLFPTETAGTYYVPSVSKRNSLHNKSQIAKGRLVDKVRNLLRLNRSIEYEKRKDANTSSATVTTISDESKESKAWLDSRVEPWSEVIEKWKYTFNIRRLSGATTVDKFFSQWPILRDPRAIMLINIDYDLIFPDAAVVNLQVDWFHFMENLIELKRNCIKDKEALQLLETLQLENNSDDTQVALHLTLLPRLIPPRSRLLLKNKKHWKFSSAEVVESILMHVKIPGDINTSISTYRDRMFELKQTVQPYILIEGPSLQDIRSVYVVVDEIRFKTDSLLKGLDLAYKAFHVANACYPVQSEYLWLVIQKCIYHITTPHDKVIPYILDIIQSLNRI